MTVWYQGRFGQYSFIYEPDAAKRSSDDKCRDFEGRVPVSPAILGNPDDLLKALLEAAATKAGDEWVARNLKGCDLPVRRWSEWAHQSEHAAVIKRLFEEDGVFLLYVMRKISVFQKARSTGEELARGLPDDWQSALFGTWEATSKTVLQDDNASLSPATAAVA